MQLKFQKGDWVFCEFKLQQIMETNENRITEVSDGMFRMGSYDISDRCFPLTLSIKRVSDVVSYWSKQFHEAECKGLNHPDLNRALISRWVDICENIDNEKLANEKMEELSKFGKSVMDKIINLKYEEVEGVRIFGR